MIFCFYARWRISQAEDTGAALTPATRRHIDACADCRRFARITQAMGDGLASAASSVHVRHEMPVREWSGVPAMAYITAGFAVMLCIGITAAGIKFNPTASSELAHGVAVQKVLVQEQDIVPVDEIFFLEQPILSELDALAQDAGNAVQFMDGYLASLL